MKNWRKSRPDGECPGCGAHVVPDKTIVKDSTIKGSVYALGDLFIADCKFDLPGTHRAEFKAKGHFSLTNALITTVAGINLSGGAIAPVAASEPRATPELELTFGVEAIVAWRAWEVVDFVFRGGATEKRLAPYTAHMPWEPMERMEAICTSGGHHEAPWQTCSCGIWAVRDRETAEGVGPEVIGSVYLWGRVLEFEKGYRAQYAYPKELVAPDQETADDLARTYGIPTSVDAG